MFKRSTSTTTAAFTLETPDVASASPADSGRGSRLARQGLPVAEQAGVRVDQSAGLPLADGHEHGPVHGRVHGQRGGRPAAPALGQRQVEGRELGATSHSSL